MAEKNREVSRKRRGAATPKEKVEKQVRERYGGRVMTKMLAASSGRVFMIKYCDNCGAGILEGAYYSCTVCDDYDLCEDCEKDNDQAITEGRTPHHNPDHVTIKYRI